jgi:hypothetical protein
MRGLRLHAFNSLESLHGSETLIYPQYGRRNTQIAHKREIYHRAARDFHVVHSILPSPDPA